MVRLIVNGDDFGMTEGNTLGIVKAHKDGILMSTTMMTNMPFASFAANLMKDYPDLGVGLHLTLSAGYPLLKDHKTLVDESGKFLSQTYHIKNKPNVDLNEIEKEYEAQMQKFIELTGILPTHIDHHHSQSMITGQLDMILKMGKKYGIPIRGGKQLYGDDYDYELVAFERGFYGDNISEEQFLNDELNILKNECIELMSHPAYVDYNLYQISSYNITRTKEMAILTSPKILEWVKDNNIELINYRSIKK